MKNTNAANHLQQILDAFKSSEKDLRKEKREHEDKLTICSSLYDVEMVRPFTYRVVSVKTSRRKLILTL